MSDGICRMGAGEPVIAEPDVEHMAEPEEEVRVLDVDVPDEIDQGYALPVHPGDVLVISTEAALTSYARESLGERINKAFPGHKLLILDQGMHLNMIRPVNQEVTETLPDTVSPAVGDGEPCEARR